MRFRKSQPIFKWQKYFSDVWKAVSSMKSSGIGGQAVIEGVMMKNKDRYAIAVRKPDKMIETKIEQYDGLAKKHPMFKYPILRGVGAFIESMVIGMKTLTYSASFYEEEEIKPSKLETTMGKVFKEKAESAVMGITVVVSILAAIGIFMVLPFFIAEFFKKATDSATVLALIEGVIRMGIFIAYVVGISQMQDIKRVFMYHGAEHKTINCVENGKELTIENVRTQSRYHKRCGTSFLFLVMFISILFFMVIRVDDMALRMALRILLVPVIAGVSYEFIRLAGRSDNGIVNLLSKPGMWLQGLTTREPEDDMIEVAIQSVEAVFDWRAYQQEARQEEEAKKAVAETAAVQETEEQAADRLEKGEIQEDKEEVIENRPVVQKEALKKEIPKETALQRVDLQKEASQKETFPKGSQKEEIPKEEASKKEEKTVSTTIRAVKKAENSRTVRETRWEREHALAEKESRKEREFGIPMESISRPEEDDDDDEILKALDKYFDEI